MERIMPFRQAMNRPSRSSADGVMPSLLPTHQSTDSSKTPEAEFGATDDPLAQDAHAHLPSSKVPPSKVPLEARIRLISALAALHKTEHTRDDLRRAQAGTMSAYKLAVNNRDDLLASRCAFYVAYTHALEAASSSKHRDFALEYLSRASEGREHGSIEGAWASTLLNQRALVTENDAKAFESDNTLKRLAGLALDTDVRPSTSGSDAPSTDDSMSSAILRQLYGSLPGNTQTNRGTPSPPGSADTPPTSVENTPQKVCRPDRPTPEFLATVAALQKQDEQRSCRPDKPTPDFLATVAALAEQDKQHAAMNEPDSDVSPPSSHLSPCSKASSTSTDSDSGVQSPVNSPRNSRRIDVTKANDPHRRSLSRSLLSGTKQRSEEAQMEEGKSPTQISFSSDRAG